MLKKDLLGKGAGIVLVISMFGMGAPAVPSAYAANVGTASQVSVQNEQDTPINVLSKLEIQGVPFDQNFTPNNYQYMATVENNVQSVLILADSDLENAKITINGQTVQNDIAQLISLKTGENKIAIRVDEGSNPTITYNLTITRKQSSNNLLGDLQVSAGELSPKFDAATTAYTVQVGNEINEITVTPVTGESTETAKVNETPTNGKGVTVQLPVGKTAITILVTAENGAKETYTIEVTKAGATSGSSATSNPGTSSSGGSRPSNMNAGGSTSGSNKNAGSFASRYGSAGQMQGLQQGGATVQQPSKATLSVLTVTAGTWNKIFSKDVYTYHIAVSNDTNSVTINGTSTYSGATVTIGDGTSSTISLGEQKKTIVPVVVTKDDERKTYILVIDKDIPQAVATAASSSPAITDTTASADPSVKSSSVNQATNNWNGQNNNNSSTSFWSRLLESIRSFFSKL